MRRPTERLVLIATILVWSLFIIAQATPYIAFQNTAFTTTTTSRAIDLTRTAVTYHKISWNITGGTFSACQVQVDTSADNSSWSSGGAITTQLCTSNGASSAINVVANYVRVNVTTLTGTAVLHVTYTGYANNPAGGGGGTPGGSDTQMQYNSSGSFAGDTGTTTDGAGNVTLVTVTTSGSNGGFGGTEGTGANAPCGAAKDCVYPDSTAHRFKMKNNNGTATQVVASGSDINTSDNITATHLASPLPRLQGGTALAALPWSCQTGMGDGVNAFTSATYLQSFCYNDTGSTITITGIKCYTDGGTPTLNATNGAGSGLLTGAVTCTTGFAAGTQSATTTIAAGDFIKFSFASGSTAKQTTWVVTGTF